MDELKNLRDKMFYKMEDYSQITHNILEEIDDVKETYIDYITHFTHIVCDINEILEIINPEKTKDIEAFNIMKSYLENEIKLFKS